MRLITDNLEVREPWIWENSKSFVITCPSFGSCTFKKTYIKDIKSALPHNTLYGVYTVCTEFHPFNALILVRMIKYRELIFNSNLRGFKFG